MGKRRTKYKENYDGKQLDRPKELDVKQIAERKRRRKITLAATMCILLLIGFLIFLVEVVKYFMA